MTNYWYPFYPREFRRDTYHLCAAADGIYRRFIDEYMDTRRPLPDSDVALAAIARVSSDEWNVHREVVRAFFKPQDGKLFHKRCEQELHGQAMRLALRSAAGKEGAAVRWAKDKLYQSSKWQSNGNGIATPMATPSTLHKKDKKETSDGEIKASPYLIAALKNKGVL